MNKLADFIIEDIQEVIKRKEWILIDNSLHIDNFETAKVIISRLYDKLKNEWKIINEEDKYKYENYIQLLKRWKDNKEKDNNKSTRILSFYASWIEWLEKRKDVIKLLSNHTWARSYINLNLKSKKRLAYKLISEIARKLDEYEINNPKQFPKIDKIINTTYSKYWNETNLWLIDIDLENVNLKDLIKVEEILKQIIENIPTNWRNIENIYYWIILTKNWFHIITSWFNIGDFNKNIQDIKNSKLIKEIDIKKHPLTVLYT